MTKLLGQTVSCQYPTPFSPYPAGDPARAMAALRQSGFNAVELVIAEPEKADAAALCAQARQNDLTITTLATGQAYGLWGWSLSALDEEKALAAVRYLCCHIDLAERLGGCPVTVGTIRGRSGANQKMRALTILRKTMSLCLQYARERGIVLQLEPLNSEETNLINTTQEALDFWESLGRPENMGILFDTYHAAFAGEDLPASIAQTGSRITNVHLSDYPGRGLPFTGSTNFPALYAALCSAGYKGPLTLEARARTAQDWSASSGYEALLRLVHSQI